MLKKIVTFIKNLFKRVKDRNWKIDFTHPAGKP